MSAALARRQVLGRVKAIGDGCLCFSPVTAPVVPRGRIPSRRSEVGRSRPSKRQLKLPPCLSYRELSANGHMTPLSPPSCSFPSPSYRRGPFLTRQRFYRWT